MKTDRIESLYWQYLKLSAAEQHQFESLIDSRRSPLGQEGEDLIARIPNIQRALKGNGIDFTTRAGVHLEIKFARTCQAGHCGSMIDTFSWANIDSANRGFDRLICIGKFSDGGYVFYDLPKAVIKDFSAKDGTEEYIKMTSRPTRWRTKRLAFEGYRITWLRLTARYR
jgi:hypothetical protein